MSSAILLETNGTYTRRNGYFGSYLEFLDIAYDRDTSFTYVVALQPDNSLAFLKTEDDGGTFTDLGWGDLTTVPTYAEPWISNPTGAQYIRGTMVAGGGLLTFARHNGNASYGQVCMISTTGDFTTGWTELLPATSSKFPWHATRIGDLYLFIKENGIWTAASPDPTTATKRTVSTFLTSATVGGHIGIGSDGVIRALGGTGYYATSADGITWSQGTESFPTSHTTTTDKLHCVHGRVAIGDTIAISAFQSTAVNTYGGNIVVHDFNTSTSTAHEIGVASAGSNPKNKCVAVAWEPVSAKFFATTVHEDTSVVTYWEFNPSVDIDYGLDWTEVVAAGAPSGALEIPQMSAVLEVVA